MSSPDRNMLRVKTFMEEILGRSDSFSESPSKSFSGMSNSMACGNGISVDQQSVPDSTAPAGAVSGSSVGIISRTIKDNINYFYNYCLISVSF